MGFSVLVRNKIKKVIREIEIEKERKITHLRESFEKEKKRIKEEVEKEVDEFLKIERAKRIAYSTLRYLKEILHSREEVFKILLEILRKEIEEKRRRNEYRSIFKAFFEEALKDFGYKRGIIFVSPVDKDLALELLRERSLDFEIRTTDDIFAGVILERIDGRVRVLNTVESRLKKGEHMILERLYKEVFSD